jgi:hypothetical protein
MSYIPRLVLADVGKEAHDLIAFLFMECQCLNLKEESRSAAGFRTDQP